MKIWLCRHGQTDLNRDKRMQGRTDCPLNEPGRVQAALAAEKAAGVKFDAVYASPLDRAIETACIVSGTERSRVIIDERIIETDFGKYEKKKYWAMGLSMTLYWALPEVFPAPPTVESIASMVKRVHAFLTELRQTDAENVLVVCHGGIIRVLSGCLEGRKNGIKWRPKPKNTELRVYELDNFK